MGKEYQRYVNVASLVPFPDEPLLADNFDAILQWALAGTGSDYEGYRTPACSLSGIYSLYLRTKATTPATGDLVAAVRYGPLHAARYLDFSFAFLSSQLAVGTARLRASINIYPVDEAVTYSYNIRIDCATNKIQRYSAAGAWVDIADIINPPFAEWNKFRMVIDQKDHKIHSFETGNLLFKIGELCYQDADAGYYGVNSNIEVETRAASRAELFVDNVIIKPSSL